jgi:hypothetical protein
VAKSGQQTYSAKRAAEELSVSTAWVRAQIASGVVTPERSSSKRNARFLLTATDLDTLREAAGEDPAAGGPMVLARVSRLEAERANLLAQVAWERAIAQEQQKALEIELARSTKLAADLELQHTRIEALKALSAWDRVRGRHKAI